MNTSLAFRLQKETAELLEKKLEAKEITESRASEIADFIIKTLPDIIKDEEVLKLLPHLDDVYTELEEIVDLHLIDIDENRKSEVADKATSLIKQGNANSANLVINNFITKK